MIPILSIRSENAFRLKVQLVFWLAVIIGLLWAFGAFGASPATVPDACKQYQRILTAKAHNTFGIDAPIPLLASQIQQESACNPLARSPFAGGLTQFTPGTAADMAKRYPIELGPADVNNPAWAIGAQVLYMRDLTRAAPGKTECDTWAFGLASYNGGAGWLQRDRAEAKRLGQPSDVWFGAVEITPDRRRAPQFIAENRGYPKRIMLTLMPIYVAGGYGRGVVCTTTH